MSRDAGESRGVRVRRFDADRKDREITLEQAVSARLGERQLLWIDLGGTIEGDDLAGLGERFELEEETRAALAEPGARPRLAPSRPVARRSSARSTST